MMLRFLFGLIVAVAATSAHAADLRVPDSAPVVGVFDWSGLYAGVHAGGIFTDFDNNVPANPGPVGEAGGPMGGVQVGFNWQSGQWVYGIEGDASAIDLRARSATRTFDEDFMGTLRLRGGFAWDRVLAYVTAGIAVTYVEAAQLGVASDSALAAGPAAGVGAEVAFGQRWSLKGEYLFVHVPEVSLTTGPPVPTVGGSDNHILRAGANFHF